VRLRSLLPALVRTVQGHVRAIESLYHIETSYLRGEDAAFVYDMMSYYIFQNDDAARGTVEPGEDEPDSSAF
jgi:hypothetical protein